MEQSFSSKQIEDAERRLAAHKELLGNAIGEARGVSFWCQRHHPAAANGKQGEFERDHMAFEARMAEAMPASRLLIAQAMHAHFAAIKQEGEAELQRQREAHFQINLRHQMEERKAIAKAHWADAHPLRKAFVMLRDRVDDLNRRLGSIGPEGDMEPLLDDLDVALTAISTTAGLERKPTRKTSKAA